MAGAQIAQFEAQHQQRPNWRREGPCKHRWKQLLRELEVVIAFDRRAAREAIQIRHVGAQPI